MNWFVKNIQSEFKINLSKWIGVFCLIVLVILLNVIPFEFFNKQEPLNVLQPKTNSFKKSFSKAYKKVCQKFNPNSLSEAEWMQLGFSEKQTTSILKYKNFLGGEFHSKQEIKACFVISDKKYQEISSFILLPEKNSFVSQNKSTTQKITAQTITINYKKFNPNDLQIFDWIDLGFTENQAKSILKYKSYLGGSFSTKEQLKECFVISPKKYKEVENYIQIPEKIVKENEINSMQIEDFVSVGFDNKIASRIVNYRNYLGGFVAKEQLKEVYGIMESGLDEKLTKLKINNSVLKIDINRCEISTLFKHPYLRKIAKNIIQFKKEKGEIEVNDVLNLCKETNLNCNLLKLYLQ